MPACKLNMNFYKNLNPKKKLDFLRPTFDEPNLKIPCVDATAKHEQSIESNVSHQPSERSEFADDEESSRDSEALSTVQSERVCVVLRLKPTNGDYSDVYNIQEADSTVTMKGNHLNQLSCTDRHYTFSSILNQSTDQKTVYDRIVRVTLEEPFASTGAAFSSYGVSNSGKTYTILGEKSSAGIVPRALTQLFCQYQKQISQYPIIKVTNDQITFLSDSQIESDMDTKREFLDEARKLNKGKMQHDWVETIKDEHKFEPKSDLVEYQKIYIWISFVEIHNEKLNDLFKFPKKKTGFQHPLKIYSNNQNSYVRGLTWLHVSSIEDALELLQYGVRRANYASTDINSHSSRSHTVFNVNIISECGSSFEYASYKFCDFAGAERISKTGNVGERLKETGGINSSLMVLGRCLEAVHESQKLGVKKSQVPVRESKLTFLLQSSLLGQEKFVMIVNMLPSLEYVHENINVLHFGSIAHKIVTRKIEPKKASRGSSHYTYFMQHAVNSPKMNSSFEETFTDRGESSLDLSFQRNQMSAEELRHELVKKDAECDALRKIIEEKEREFLNREKKLRMESSRTQDIARESERKFFEEKEEILKNKFERKMENIRQQQEKQLQDLYSEIDFLTYENKKLKRNIGKSVDSEDIIDLDDDEEMTDENQSPNMQEGSGSVAF